MEWGPQLIQMTVQYRCSQHRWHSHIMKVSTDIQGSLESSSPENRPIWFLLWEGNQVASVQLVIRELWGMATMHRQNVFTACRKAARGIQFGMPALGISTSQGLTWLCQRCVPQGAMAKSHLWMCSHRSCSSNFCFKPVTWSAARAQKSPRARKPAQRPG